jgi:hypothetical protein
MVWELKACLEVAPAPAEWTTKIETQNAKNIRKSVNFDRFLTTFLVQRLAFASVDVRALFFRFPPLSWYGISLCFCISQLFVSLPTHLEFQFNVNSLSQSLLSIVICN